MILKRYKRCEHAVYPVTDFPTKAECRAATKRVVEKALRRRGTANEIELTREAGLDVGNCMHRWRVRWWLQRMPDAVVSRRLGPRLLEWRVK
jgi:hypothetical protein